MYNLEDVITNNNNFALTYENEGQFKRIELNKNINQNLSRKLDNQRTAVIENNFFNKIQEECVTSTNTQTENVEEYTETQKTHKEKTHKENTNSTFVNIHSKSYFWILYIIIHGEEEYKLVDPKQYFSKEQELRYTLIDTIQKMPASKKDFIKAHKIKLQTIISELGNNQHLTLQSFIGLCIILNQNVCLVKNKVAQTYMNNNVNNDVLCIDVNKEKLYTNVVSLKDCENKYYLVENIIKPFKAISSYKVDELRQLCERLDINVNKADGKNRTKKELYQELIDKIEI